MLMDIVEQWTHAELWELWVCGGIDRYVLYCVWIESGP